MCDSNQNADETMLWRFTENLIDSLCALPSTTTKTKATKSVAATVMLRSVL